MQAASRVFPRRNPFPVAATASQDERPAGPSAPNGVLNLPTAPLPAVEQVWKVTGAYLKSSAEGCVDYGQVVFVHGDHGAGKTHAVLHALGRVPELTGELYRFYVKAEDDDLVALYRRLMGQLDLAGLRDISLRFLGMIAGEEAGRSFGEEAEATFLTRVRKAPELVYSLYETLTIEPGAVLQQQAAEVTGVVGGRADFQRALAYLLDPVLQSAAYAWLVGRDITTDEASRLGVGGPIREPQLCRYGIQLLVSISTRIGRPIVVTLDQCERLIFDRDGAICRSNVGLLHSLVETVPQANGMLVLMSSHDAWRALPRDFQQRISHEIQALSLSPGQATELLAAYVGAVTGISTADDPYPFTAEAVRMLLELSGGNTRRLLQQAWEAFDQAPPDQPITSDLVKRTVGRGRGRITEAEARLGIEGMLFESRLTFERDWRRQDIHADYAVPAGSSPHVLIWISQAAFANDEVQKALRHANLMRQVQIEGLTVRVILVVLGYCSPYVLIQLERSAHDVIVYDGPGALERLRVILAELPGRETPAPADSLGMTGVIDALQQAVAARDQEVTQLRADIGMLLERFSEGTESAIRVKTGRATRRWEPAFTRGEATKLELPKSQYDQAAIIARRVVEEHQILGTARDQWEPTPNLNDVLAAPFIADGEQELTSRLKREADPALDMAHGLMEDVMADLYNITEHTPPITAPESGINYSTAAAADRVGEHDEKIDWDALAGRDYHHRAPVLLKRLATWTPWLEAAGFLTFVTYYLNVPLIEPWQDWLGWSFAVVVVAVIILGQTLLVRHASKSHNQAREDQVEGRHHETDRGIKKRNWYLGLTGVTVLAVAGGMIWRGIAALGHTDLGTTVVMIFAAALTGLLLPTVAYLGFALDGSTVSRERDDLAAQLDEDLDDYLATISDSRRDLAAVAEIGDRLKTKAFPDICRATQEAVDAVYEFHAAVRMLIGDLKADPPVKTTKTIRVDPAGTISGYIGTSIPGAGTVNLGPLFDRQVRLAKIEAQRASLVNSIDALPPHPWGKSRT